MADITLTSGMRTNLLQLQNTEKLMDRTQARIATGKKVNSALDGPAAFFAAKALSDRAGDLASLKESMGQAISTIKSADTAITSITTLVQQAKAVANTAKQNLGTDSASIALRASSAAQYDELLTQINTLVEDAGYAGKNLLLGDGSTYDATAASVTNVDALTGVSSTSVTNIGGGTSASNISVAVTGVVDVTATSAGTVESALGATAASLTTTGFTTAGTMTIAIADEDATLDHVSVSNTYSTGYTTMADGAGAADLTMYAISEGSAVTASTDLGLSNLQVTNWSDAENVALAITSTGGTTTFAVTAPTTNLTQYTVAQTAADGDTSATQTFVYGDKTQVEFEAALTNTAGAGDFAISTIGENSSGSQAVSVTVASAVGAVTTSDFSMTVTYADGSTATSSVQNVAKSATNAAVSLSVDGTAVTFTADQAAVQTITIDLSSVTFDAAGVTAGSNAGTASLDFGTVVLNVAGTTGAGIAASSTITMEDARDVTITQGTATYTRAVAPATGEGTLSTGTNTFVLSNGVSVGMSVDLNTLSAGSSTLAAYTVTAGGTSNDLEVFFNEDSTSSVSINSVKSNADGMSIATAANGWNDAADIDQAVTQLDAALSSLRTTGQTLTNSLSIVQTREDFTKAFINNLEEGANKWTLADANEEGANMLMLQTRQQLGTVTLSIASQSAQSILRLFG